MKKRIAYGALIVFALAGIIFALYRKANAPLVTIPLAGTAGRSDFSPDGSMIAVCTDSGVALYETSSWKRIHFLAGPAEFVYWLPDKTLLTYVFYDRTTGVPPQSVMARWNMKTSPPTLIYRKNSDTKLLGAISHDAGTIALYSRQGLEIFSTKTGQRIHRFPDLNIFEPHFSPDGKFLATASWPRPTLIRVWDTRTWQEVPGITRQKVKAECVRFSPDSRILATGTDKLITFWDTGTWQIVRTMPAHFKYLFRLRFSPDGTRLAGGGRFEQEEKQADFFWTLWNPVTGEHIADIHNAYFWDFLPGSKIAITADEETALWNEATGKQLWSSLGHVAYAGEMGAHKPRANTAVAISPNGKTLITTTTFTTTIDTSLASTDHDSAALQVWNMPHQ